MPVPRHIAIILDGNRRFAKRLMMKPWKGHEWGAEKVRKLLEWSKELGVKEVTLYTFSVENFKRPKEEFDYLMHIFETEFESIKQDPRIKEIRINFIGRIWMFPEAVQTKMRELMALTKDNRGSIVNFAMAYGGRQEIIDAVRHIAQQVKAGTLDIEAINAERFGKELYLESEPDLIIRTGGEKRLSNFLLWQCSYSELFFIEKMWPEFEKEDLVDVMTEFGNRQRRFGA